MSRNKRLLLPCVRGTIGDWVTYVCMMRLKDIAELIDFAREIHTSEGLSDMIQRNLKDKRASEIGNYLLTDDEAFFNSLVVGVYEGDPKWHQFDSITEKGNINPDEFDYPDYADDSIGFLSLSRKECIFALDGQHRLAGIKYAIKENPDLGYKQIPVIFLPHYNNEVGLKRTRRLFTSLNKKAKPVEKEAIIALDEDDLGAVITRYLVEETVFFDGDKLKYSAQNNISASDSCQLTTIGALYDIVKIIIKVGSSLSGSKISNFRGSETDKNEIIYLVEEVFNCLFDRIPALSEFQMKGIDRSYLVEKYRNSETGGHLLYRPIGMKLFFETFSDYCKMSSESFEISSSDFISLMSNFDFNLQNELFSGIIWDPNKKKMMSAINSEEKKQLKDAMLRHVN